jgi:hypothetical protein
MMGGRSVFAILGTPQPSNKRYSPKRDYNRYCLEQALAVELPGFLSQSAVVDPIEKPRSK